MSPGATEVCRRLGLLRRKRIKQFEPQDLGWEARAAEVENGHHSSVRHLSSSSSSSMDSHCCSGQPTASSKENEVILKSF